MSVGWLTPVELVTRRGVTMPGSERNLREKIADRLAPVFLIWAWWRTSARDIT